MEPCKKSLNDGHCTASQVVQNSYCLVSSKKNTIALNHFALVLGGKQSLVHTVLRTSGSFSCCTDGSPTCQMQQMLSDHLLVFSCILQTELSFQFLYLATISCLKNAFAITTRYELCSSGQCWPRPAARPEQRPLQLLCSVSTSMRCCGSEAEGGTPPTETGAELEAAGEVSEHKKPAGTWWDNAGPISRVLQALGVQ